MDEPIISVARCTLFHVGKCLMVDEASTGLRHVEACLGKGCAAIAQMYDTCEFPSTHDKCVAAMSIDLVFSKFW